MSDVRLAMVIPIALTDEYFSRQVLEGLLRKHNRDQSAADAIFMLGESEECASAGDLTEAMEEICTVVDNETGRDAARFYVVDGEAEMELEYGSIWDTLKEGASYGDILLFMPTVECKDILELPSGIMCGIFKETYGPALREDSDITGAIWIINREDD